ncbi:hypothetical protein IKT64_01690 [Candidatus Saccharibacteria bacterium]|nr:hypothetical protein [Candidatus Saccharibacteria bacterium]
MKANSKLKLGIGAIVAALFAIMPSSAFATVKAGTEDITSKTSNTAGTVKYDSSTKTITLDGYAGDITITGQDATIKTTSKQADKKIGKITIVGDATTQKPVLTIDDSANLVTTGDVAAYHKATGTAGIKLGSKLCSKSGSADIKTSSSSSFSAIYTLGGPVNLSADNCKNSKSPDTPETLDAIYVYVAILVASSAIFAYRRYLAKR